MAKFLTFETTAIRLNDSIFPSNSASFGLQANTVPVFDINGNLIDYAPNGPIQGKFSTEFYLTGALPDFLKLENQSDVPISVSFNNFNIPSAFLTDLSFSVEPYQPIAVSTSFDFYHGIKALDTNLNDVHNLFSPADGSTKVKNKLATLNGLSSYIITNNRSSYPDNYDDFIVSNFNYSFTVERQPLLRVKQSIPLRVALRQINAQFGVTANNIDGILDIHGNDAVFNAVLKDAQNPSVYTNMSLTGIIVDQNYAISDSSYGVGSIKMIQNISKKRNIISIPFGTNDPQIVETAPPVLGIWTPTIVAPTIPRQPIPPPAPPVITITPPTPPPPTLDPNLIWFNIYVRLYDLNPLCSYDNGMPTLRAYKIDTNFADDFNNIDDNGGYFIKFKNKKQPVQFVDPEEDTSLRIFFICALGVNNNVLNAGSAISKTFNYILNSDPRSIVSHSVSSGDEKLALSASFTPYVPIDGVCQPQYETNPSSNQLDVNCKFNYVYATWPGLIGQLTSEYDGDPTKIQTLILSLASKVYIK
jgi:hypothetical protein